MIYGYVSGPGLDAQEKQLRAAGAKRVFREAVYLYGGEQFNRALAYLSHGDTLIVTSIDRLGRSTRALYNKLKKVDECIKGGARFRSLGAGETWAADTSTDEWSATLSAFDLITRIERDLGRVRIKERYEGPKASGAKAGRPPKLTAQQKHEAIKRRDAGNETRREIAASYNVSAATITRLTRLRPTT